MGALLPYKYWTEDTRYLLQAHVKSEWLLIPINAPLKTPPSSPLPLLQAACSALTPTLTLICVAQRKPTLQWGLCKCCSNHFLGSSRKNSGAQFCFRLWRSRKGPDPWTAVVRVTGGKELSQGAWGYSHSKGWPKEMKGRETEYEPSTADEGVYQQISSWVTKLKMWCTWERTKSFVLKMSFLICFSFLVIHWCTQWGMGSLEKNVRFQGRGYLAKGIENIHRNCLNISACTFSFAYI